MDEKQRYRGPIRGRRAAAAAATAAVVALTAGCTAQASGAGAPGGTRPGAAVSAPPDGAAAGPADKSVSAPTAAPTGSAEPSPGAAANASPAATRPASPSGAGPTTRPPAPRVFLARGAEGAPVRELQARLRQIGHFTRTPTGHYGSVTAAAVTSFQGKRALPRTGTTDTVTWDRLLGMTRKPTRAELHPTAADPVAAPDPRCLTGRVLCVSKTSRTLSWMIDGRVVSAMDVRFGSQYTPTREGTFEVYWKSRHHVSTLYDSPMPYALFFSGGQAVHYSSDFAARGYGGASHGCVNVRDEGKIASLFGQVRNGDKVVIHW